ncbi:MAG TPA: 2-amino-4-hydroxy-6-hydroxymethyldihydropteridine diphosphokinase [Thermotogota bacterium]|nr:2-amino-4-hydroxy-6-hydroxymethyldihydropteridine diphosphokinase [Thermotogota bacterium]HPH10865.1 2-amino-4-hydroxy-6-hydroxymethyldihydropteridine diphosphokinase [Thermotogota bacterium]HPM21589.1 2-amino-4-hydroxy-6-hydroxymethyldihydropteridine diphosphokinase [Thermotogota bacterium]HQC37304.1 2-amino-4-hydroxy-6-hydroxymethyldihydropteridine diphosphokinase [Thermotogota bacterium]
MEENKETNSHIHAVYLALGTNVGDRKSHLLCALKTLEKKGVRVVLRSNLYASKAYGYAEQDDFYNMVVGVLTDLPPFSLLKTLKEVERECGRSPTFHWGPREIDIDIILYGNLVLSDVDLTVPHPDFRNRDFVLRPLMEVGQMIVDPITGRTIEDLYRLLGKDTCVNAGSLDTAEEVSE